MSLRTEISNLRLPQFHVLLSQINNSEVNILNSRCIQYNVHKFVQFSYPVHHFCSYCHLDVISCIDAVVFKNTSLLVSCQNDYCDTQLH